MEALELIYVEDVLLSICANLSEAEILQLCSTCKQLYSLVTSLDMWGLRVQNWDLLVQMDGFDRNEWKDIPQQERLQYFQQKWDKQKHYANMAATQRRLLIKKQKQMKVQSKLENFVTGYVFNVGWMEIPILWLFLLWNVLISLRSDEFIGGSYIVLSIPLYIAFFLIFVGVITPDITRRIIERYEPVHIWPKYPASAFNSIANIHYRFPGKHSILIHIIGIFIASVCIIVSWESSNLFSCMNALYALGATQIIGAPFFLVSLCTTVNFPVPPLPSPRPDPPTDYTLTPYLIPGVSFLATLTLIPVFEQWEGLISQTWHSAFTAALFFTCMFFPLYVIFTRFSFHIMLCAIFSTIWLFILAYHLDNLDQGEWAWPWWGVNLSLMLANMELLLVLYWKKCSS